MPFSLDLETHGYLFHPNHRVWKLPSGKAFSYSDGSEAEARLAAILNEESDLSVFSAALKRHCTDWVTHYHFSQERANLLRPLAHLLRGETLEIGAGCGAITRYLGELGGRVLALEGSERRSGIAALRTRDLENVNVICCPFEEFRTGQQFDAVTLIGVLEYAPAFGQGEDPIGGLLQHAQALLKPDGVLIVAIENQLGLKYLAGVPEDHVGQPYFGVQDLYRPDGVVTFGRHELEERLRRAGFEQLELALPFPDYKLPMSVILPAALENDTAFDAALFAGQSVTMDRQITQPPRFSIESAWQVVGRNRLLAELSNSFLYVASRAKGAPRLPSDTLAFHYTTHRVPAFCKQTEFLRSPEGGVVIRRKSIAPQAPRTGDSFSHVLADEPFAKGMPMDLCLIHKIVSPRWSPADLTGLLQQYIDILIEEAERLGHTVTTRNEETVLPGELLDACPQNILVTATGSHTFIDQEWSSKEPLTLGYAIFRALTTVGFRVSTFAVPADHRLLRQRNLFEAVFEALGFCLTESTLEKYLQREREFQIAVCGVSYPLSVEAWSNYHFPSSESRMTLLEAGSSRQERDAFETETQRLQEESQRFQEEAQRFQKEAQRLQEETQWFQEETQRFQEEIQRLQNCVEAQAAANEKLKSKKAELQRAVDSAVAWQHRSWTTRAFHRWRIPKKP